MAEENGEGYDMDAEGTQAPAGPSDFLTRIVGQPVMVRLNSGVDYKGILTCLDGYMNLALEKTEEFVSGRKTGDYGDAFIRGNNVLYLSAL